MENPMFRSKVANSDVQRSTFRGKLIQHAGFVMFSSLMLFLAAERRAKACSVKRSPAKAEPHQSTGSCTMQQCLQANSAQASRCITTGPNSSKK